MRPSYFWRNSGRYKPKRMSVRLRLSQDVGSVLSFPNGVPDHGDDMNIKRKRNSIVSNLNNVKYETTGDNANDCNYLIGIMNKKKNELLLMPTDGISIMKPTFVNEDFYPVPLVLGTMTNDERRSSLTEEFGSSKKKRAVKANASNVILSENIAGNKVLSNVMVSQYADTPMLDAGRDALQVIRETLLPKFNADAEDVKDIFPISELIPGHLSYALEQHYDEKYQSMFPDSTYNSDNDPDIEASIKSTFSMWQQFLRDNGAGVTITYLMTAKYSIFEKYSNEKNMKKMKKKFSYTALRSYITRVLLLHDAILFHNQVASKEWKQSSHDELKQVIVGPKKTLFHLGDNYGHSDKRDGLKVYVRSKIETEKLLIFIIILYTTINDYDAINLNILGQDLTYKVDKLQGLARESGFKISKDKDSVTVAELSVPLTFPEPRKKRGKA